MNDPHWFDREVRPRLTIETAYAGVEWASRSGDEWRAACPIHRGGNPSSFVVNAKTLLWHCKSTCDGGGSPVDFAWSMRQGVRERPRGRDAWLVMRELGERVGVEPEGASTRESIWERNPPPARQTAKIVSYPPIEQVREMWMARLRPSTGAAAALEAWGVDPASVDDECGVIPPRWVPPRWARTCGRRWGWSAYEIIIPLVDASMQLRSYVARSIAPPADAPKTGCPAGFTTRGLVMANRAARDAVRTGACEWGVIVIREGDRDHLFESQRGAPVISTRSGAWSDDLTRRLPHGITLEIATDDDPKGEELADVIVESRKRCGREDIHWARTYRAEAA